MPYLLDTHSFLWAFIAQARLSQAVRTIILTADDTIYFSAVNVMEIETKYRIGKLPEAQGLVESFYPLVNRAGFVPLNVTIEHARLAGALKIDHKDPFDRLLIAQAICDGLILISNETLFDSFGVRRIW
jgi:PIN domain nuclease of toxin-antitoxin system